MKKILATLIATAALVATLAPTSLAGGGKKGNTTSEDLVVYVDPKLVPFDPAPPPCICLPSPDVSY
jgi:hypothetical protein